MKKMIMVLYLLLSVALCGCRIWSFEYMPDEAEIEFVLEYINVRYEGVNSDNIEDRYAEQDGFYSNSFKGMPSWVNSSENKQASKEFFESHSYQSQVLRKQVEYENKTYIADFSVLYVADEHEYDCYADYRMVLKLCNQGGIKIQSIDSVDNQAFYIEGAELHVMPDKVELVFEGDD